MIQATETLTVFFEEPFWVGIFERVWDGNLTVCKVTFGAEPKDYTVYDFILKHYAQLHFGPAVPADVKEARRNPKRMQREVHKQLQNPGIGTKSQQALKLAQELGKAERKSQLRECREAEQVRQFEKKQQKKKEKHKGR